MNNFTLKPVLGDLEPWAGPLNSKSQFNHLRKRDHGIDLTIVLWELDDIYKVLIMLPGIEYELDKWKLLKIMIIRCCCCAFYFSQNSLSVSYFLFNSCFEFLKNISSQI